MVRVIACATAAFVAASVNAHAQRVTTVPGQDTLVVSGVGKVRLAGIAGLEPALRMGSGGPTPPPRSGPSSPPPALIGGRLNLSRNRGARDFLRKLVLGKDVTLEFDDAAGRADVPRAYVFLEDGTFVNAELLRQGKARIDGSTPLARIEELRRVEKEAQDARRGVWAVGSDKR